MTEQQAKLRTVFELRVFWLTPAGLFAEVDVRFDELEEHTAREAYRAAIERARNHGGRERRFTTEGGAELDLRATGCLVELWRYKRSDEGRSTHRRLVDENGKGEGGLAELVETRS